MINESSFPLHSSNGHAKPAGIERVISQAVDEHAFYGSGKVALRDALVTLASANRKSRDCKAVEPAISHSLSTDGSLLSVGHRSLSRRDRTASTGKRANGRDQRGDSTDTTQPSLQRRSLPSKPTVLLPSYIPDAVVEPVSDAGMIPEFYAVETDLGPDCTDLEARLADDTLAVLSVNYFGFPHPRFEEFRALLERYDCFHIDDNAHSALSVADGTLLGTRGHVGFTSLRKLLPIPNGAILYLSDETIADRFVPSDRSGINDRIDRRDCRYILGSLARRVLDSSGTVGESISSLLSEQLVNGSRTGSKARYDAHCRPMSRLAYSVLRDADPDDITSARRENFRAWARWSETRTDLEPLYTELPSGICPKGFPIRASYPSQFLATLEQAGVTAHTWPRLPTAVERDPAYRTATRLATSVIELPVHQHVRTNAIESVCTTLSD